MEAERWQKIKSVFDGALEVEAAGRADFVAEACEEDTDLKDEVLKLLDSFKVAGSFIEQPAANEVASLILESHEPLTVRQFAHYRIVNKIGSGGMGDVYLAVDEKLDRRVAIKILNEEFSRHEVNVQRFVREAKAASSLNHHNILVIHEIHLGDDANYIVSEYVEGKTLRQMMRGSNLRISEILNVAIQICGALSAAHAANIVHRDIKPENVMIRPDGYIKILDFGLAKLLETRVAAVSGEEETEKHYHTAQGLILGTVNYMSPEQAKGEMVDGRTDIFSLGIVIFELVTGKTPFRGDSMSETFANLINTEPQPITRFASNVPDELQRIVDKSLRKQRDKRYQKIEELESDLKSLFGQVERDESPIRLHSSKNSNDTDVLRATIADIKINTGETNRNSTGEIERRKYRTTFAVSVFALLIGILGLGYYFYSAKLISNQSDRKSLAVLPFVNVSQDPEAEYLSDGITESVINNLSQLSGLKVMSRNSAFRFKDNQNDIRGVAAQLGVDTLVTGNISKLGDRLVINVRLIDARDDSQIWGNQYIRTSADVIVAQNDIAKAVAQNLRLKLTASDAKLLSKRYTDNPEAWQHYQRGRFYVYKLTPPEIQTGISHFQQAIDIDPAFALAYTGLADAYRSILVSGEMEPAEFATKSKAAAKKAIEIDDLLSEGHSSLGAILFWGEWDWAEAESQYKRALELNPNNALAHLFYAHLLSNLGRHSEALSEVKLSRELDPLFPFGGALEGQFLHHAGRHDEALDRLQKTVELAPNFWLPHLFASAVYIDKGMYSEAVAAARKAGELPSNQTVYIAFESYALAKMGRTEDAREGLNKLLKLSTERFIPPVHIATAFIGLGDKENAYEWLERAFKVRDPKLAFLKVDARWNNLRSEPRFVDLIKRMRLE